MSRQRTICDKNFWHSPAMDRAGCTTEDKIALLHMLTCPDSNVIGAYPLTPRIAGAEIGWTPDQWLHVVDRLTAVDLALYDRDRMFVWVKLWWEHHRASQAMGPKLRRNALDQLRQLPDPWLTPYVGDFKTRLDDAEHRDALDQAVSEGLAPSEGRAPTPYLYDIDMVSNPSRTNSNPNSIIKVTTTLQPPHRVAVDNVGIPVEYRAAVDAAIAKAQDTGVANVSAQSVRDEVAKRYRSNQPPRDVAAYAFHLAQNMSERNGQPRPVDPSPEELARWAGRCFCWPEEKPTNFIRILDSGLVERYRGEGEKWRHGHEHLCRAGFLSALREGKLCEIDGSVLERIRREAA